MTLVDNVCPTKRFNDSGAQYYLTLRLLCQQYGALPRAGGIEDQRAVDMTAFAVIESAMSEPMPAGKPAA